MLVSSVFFDKYIKRNNPDDLVCYGDQGSQYTSNSYGTKLKNFSIEQPYSERPPSCDDAVAESIYKTLKRTLNQLEVPNKAELEKDLHIYKEFYNNIRLHKMALNLLHTK